MKVATGSIMSARSRKSRMSYWYIVLFLVAVVLVVTAVKMRASKVKNVETFGALIFNNDKNNESLNKYKILNGDVELDESSASPCASSDTVVAYNNTYVCIPKGVKHFIKNPAKFCVVSAGPNRVIAEDKDDRPMFKIRYDETVTCTDVASLKAF
jgi:maltodextrin utilization protein YvdJ